LTLTPKIVLETLKGNQTQAQLTSKYGIHPTQISAWRRQFKEGVADIFKDKRRKNVLDKDRLIEELYKQIGQQKVELDWLKKNLHYSINQKRNCINPEHVRLSVSQQCHLLGLARSSYYQTALQKVGELTLTLMRLIDEEYTRHPFLGTRRMKYYLKALGHKVNRKRIQTLYHRMGIAGVHPGPRLSNPNKNHSVYPYLLRGKPISHCNQVWSTDISVPQQAA
jgi:putative transposase